MTQVKPISPKGGGLSRKPGPEETPFREAAPSTLGQESVQLGGNGGCMLVCPGAVVPTRARGKEGLEASFCYGYSCSQMGTLKSFPMPWRARDLTDSLDRERDFAFLEVLLSGLSADF